jgi:hypothetical protein
VSPAGPERPSSEGLRPGALSALIEQLVRGPESERGVGWRQALAPGMVVGRFELVREIGRGGFGVVYEARDRELGRLVAFKAVRAGHRPELRAERLVREGEAAARLSHPNVVTLFDVGRSAHGPYLVMELLRGEPLARRLSRGPLPPDDAIRVALEVARGLAHAHAEGVIHRDLKPANVFLCADGRVKVLDLGLAHAFGHRKVDGGTPAYMAPEQRRGAPEDERTDVFAMGALLREMLGGAPTEDPALADLVRRMLSEDPVDRPRDAAEVLAALAAVAGAPPPSPGLAPPPDPPPRAERTSDARSDRTWLCSVLMAEIARVADHSVELWARWKERFTHALAEAVRDVAEAERVILDTGDGAAICFLGDPDAAMACALSLLDTIVSPEEVQRSGMRVRVGVHLGPVKLVRDVNGNLNAIGDGLSEARRVMRFADDDRILVSRSFFEVASCLSEGYRALFRAGGARVDERGHEHVLYELQARPRPDGHAAGATAEPAPTSRPEPAPEPPPAPAAAPAAAAALDAEAVARIERRAAAVLGPIAHHLVRTASARASSPLELAEAVAAYVPSAREREAFLRACGREGPPRAAGSTSSDAAPALDEAVLARVGRELAAHVGPLARILVARAARRARTEGELYDLLAPEIPAPEERERFRSKGPPSGSRPAGKRP